MLPIPCYEIQISRNNSVSNSGTLCRWLLPVTCHSDCRYASFSIFSILYLQQTCSVLSFLFFAFNILTGIDKAHPRPKLPENNRWSLAI
uniref:Uncharacterized protein n=1 Tax=Rhipicephalus appendiculatus TaxID=34631 RepID=A0A131YDV0_RHIAP